MILTIGVADYVCFWVRLPQNPVAPRWNISPHLGQTEKQNYQDEAQEQKEFIRGGSDLRKGTYPCGLLLLPDIRIS